MRRKDEFRFPVDGDDVAEAGRAVSCTRTQGRMGGGERVLRAA